MCQRKGGSTWDVKKIITGKGVIQWFRDFIQGHEAGQGGYHSKKKEKSGVTLVPSSCDKKVLLGEDEIGGDWGKRKEKRSRAGSVV